LRMKKMNLIVSWRKRNKKSSNNYRNRRNKIWTILHRKETCKLCLSLDKWSQLLSNKACKGWA
jgi:hypothetical protein